MPVLCDNTTVRNEKKKKKKNYKIFFPKQRVKMYRMRCSEGESDEERLFLRIIYIYENFHITEQC